MYQKYLFITYLSFSIKRKKRFYIITLFRNNIFHHLPRCFHVRSVNFQLLTIIIFLGFSRNRGKFVMIFLYKSDFNMGRKMAFTVTKNVFFLSMHLLVKQDPMYTFTLNFIFLLWNYVLYSHELKILQNGS